MKKILYIAISAVSLVGCKLDDNIDPNLPLTEDISPRQLMAAAETTTYAAQTGTMVSLSRIWTNVVAGNYYYYAAPMTNEYQMNVTSTFANGIWNGNYLAMANLANIINNKDAAKYPYHVAISKILLANSMQYIVDFYGDAPYSEAFKQQQKISPKYDKGEDIYRDLVVKLNEAIQTIDNANVTSDNEIKANEDYIYKGDLAKWKVFANTIKLRLLLRQSNVADANVKQFVNSQLATLSSATFVSSDVKINPGYNASSQASMNPLYSNWGRYNFDHSANNGGWRYYMLSDHFAKLLNGDASKPTSGVVDPRGTVMYTKAASGANAGKLNGIIQGGDKPAGSVEGDYSRVGWTYNTAEGVGGLMDGYLMLASESELLQAEAAILYPQYFNDAPGHYTKGVNASFVFYGLTAGAATTYLASIDTKSVGWTGASDKMAAIQYQRLIALNMVRPFETYLNYLKTGYPQIPMALTASFPNKPYRLIYPQTEYVGNSANVPNVTTSDVFAKNQYTPFWLR